jgi:hypothetical protein
MKNIIKIVKLLMPHENFDALGVGVIDFKNKKFQAIEANNFEGTLKFSSDPTLYFDLASLTKPLTNSLSYFLKPEAFEEKIKLCLSHRGGLPAWGLLANPGWEELISGYPVKESPTLYSDFSALRVMLELRKKGVDQKKLCQEVWDKETMNWKDLPSWYPTPQYGYKKGLPNFGQVHDPNAWVINEFCSHAGLFSTVDGLCRTLLNYQEKTGFIEKVGSEIKKHDQRFTYGWDRVENPQETLAGRGCGEKTFGHLGFTGTSIWIDPEAMLGHVILSNAVKYYWYDKVGLNELRRALGEEIWRSKGNL